MIYKNFLFYFILIFLSPNSIMSFSTPQNQLNPNLIWFGDNREKIEGIIKQYGKNSPSYDEKRKPVAAFDWDDTMMKNDIADAVIYWLASQGKIKRPHRFSQMNQELSADALLELEKNCGGTSKFLPTRDAPACADTILNISLQRPIENGASPWKTPQNAKLKSIIFSSQLFKGYTPHEIHQITKQVFKTNTKNPIGSTQTIGTKEYPAYVRIYEQMRDLVLTLQKNGFDAWIISASPQPSVEVVAKEVGIDEDHVIGVRSVLDSEGRLTDSFLGCGDYVDGNKNFITYQLGKRCWLNKVVFQIKDAKRMLLPTPITLAAGDTEGDLIFLSDAKGGRLVIDSNKMEILCHAYQNSDGKWFVNPKFIEPLPRKMPPYHCEDFGIPEIR